MLYFQFNGDRPFFFWKSLKLSNLQFNRRLKKTLIHLFVWHTHRNHIRKWKYVGVLDWFACICFSICLSTKHIHHSYGLHSIIKMIFFFFRLSKLVVAQNSKMTAWIEVFVSNFHSCRKLARAKRLIQTMKSLLRIN